ncbi:MAG TPA: PDZ domain-containing protein [Pirellulales bacterium]|nr:PDZ domain-containing protein [Pirellulales bacterium]
MNMRTLERCRGRLALLPLVCLALCLPVRADEPPADKPNDAIPATTFLDRTSPSQVFNLSTTYALSAIRLAANADPIGADVAQIDDVLRSHLGLGEGKGLVVTGVGDDTPAAKAGIQKNDVLVAVGNEEIAGLEEFRKLLEASAEKPIALGLIRAGKKQSIDVVPRSGAAELAYQVVSQGAAEPKYWLGVGLAGADDTLRSQLAVSAGEGVVVTSVESESPAAKAGVMVNDLLLKLDGKALTTVEALSEQLQSTAGKPVALELLRRGKPATLTVTAEKHADSWQAVVNYVGNDLIFVAPRQAEIVNYTGTLTAAALNLTGGQTKPDLLRQVDELAAQVKQLEASLASLRTTIEAAK